jgi:hypothetical protein
VPLLAVNNLSSPFTLIQAQQCDHAQTRRSTLHRHGFRVFLVILAAITGCATQPTIPVNHVEPASAWEFPFIRTSGWTGADGAATIPLPNHKALWLFGDTWIGPVIGGRHAEGSTMVNNTIAISPAGPTPPAHDDIHFLWGSASGKPAAWAVPTQPGEWFWPASGGLIVPGSRGDHLLLFMARISRIDKSDSVWNFQARGSTLLSIANPADGPTSWRIEQFPLNTLGPGRRVITWGVAALCDSRESPDHLLIYGVDSASNLNKKLVLARAPVSAVQEFASWRFRTGSGWSDKEADATAVVENVSSEVSVHRLPSKNSNKWVMVYTEPPLGSGILIRTSVSAAGPWSEPTRVYTCPEPGTDPRLMVYSAKAHPELSAEGELLISYSVNSTDFWDVAAHADKYRPRFVRIPRSALQTPQN